MESTQYRVHVEVTRIYEVTVNATGPYNAEAAAEALFVDQTRCPHKLVAEKVHAVFCEEITDEYGVCPHCGAKCITRERRLNGNDTCDNGHTYPSSAAVKK